MFNALFEEIEKWMRQLLSGMVTSNLTNMFTDVNQKTGEIASQVGQTPPGLEWQYLFHDTQPLQFRHHPHRGHDHHVHTLL